MTATPQSVPGSGEHYTLLYLNDIEHEETEIKGRLREVPSAQEDIGGRLESTSLFPGYHTLPFIALPPLSFSKYRQNHKHS